LEYVYDKLPKELAAKFAIFRTARIIAAAVIAVALTAATDALAGFAPVPGEIDADTVGTFIVISVFGAGINGISKFLRDRKIVTNPPV
jgi:hypothetical protein